MASRGYPTVLVAGKHVCGPTGGPSTKTYNSNGITAQLVIDKHIARLDDMGRVRWSEHPKVQERLARAAWVRDRRQCHDDGRDVGAWEKAHPQALYLGRYYKQSGGYQLSAHEAQLIEAQKVPDSLRTMPAEEEIIQAIDVEEEIPELGAEEIATLRTRFMRRPYKNLYTFSEKNGISYDTLIAIGAGDWEAEKAAKRS